MQAVLPIIAQEPPLRIDAGGAVRIGKTRVTLQTLVEAFKEGATAEEIVQQFPTLDLAETYLAIGYYLQHRAEVDDYLQRLKEEADRIQAEIEARPESIELRARLLARRQSK
jgi:uncharacterized protein (DUF433 family)